jgi:hypothetical protein
MKGLLLGCLVAACTACAPRPALHAGPTSLSAREGRALLAAKRTRADGFERFWLRPRCRPGLIKWSAERSRAVNEAPPALLEVVRDEIGRLNRTPGEGEIVSLSVTVFEWKRRIFGLPPRVGYEIVGRDRAGQVLWLGQDRMVAPRNQALGLADTDEVLVAREIARKLRRELGR